MTTRIEQDAERVLGFLVETRDYARAMDVDQISEWVRGPQIAEALPHIAPPRINDAVRLLEVNGQAETIRTFGNLPFDFREVAATVEGSLAHQRSQLPSGVVDEPSRTSEAADLQTPPAATFRLGRLPIGSPYGFEADDWAYVEQERERLQVLKVVLGYQFESEHYTASELLSFLGGFFTEAIHEHNLRSNDAPISVNFQPLQAGLGEHLFNQIVREIIGADVAVFETSDLNSNVMIEMGVALTWGLGVIPIRVAGQPKPPSDISGQTWADYSVPEYEFVTADTKGQLVQMIQRLMRRKARHAHQPGANG